MARKNMAVLHFGSKRISVMIGDRGSVEDFDVRGYSEIEYDGFLEGEFLEPENLSRSLKEVLALAENNARCKITDLYVGVPAEFAVVEAKEVEMEFDERHKITDDDITELFDMAEVGDENHQVINRAPIYYVLDDGYKIIKPTGKITESISSMISYVMCENSFIELVRSLLAPLNIENIEFFSEELSEALYLVQPEERDNIAILVDSEFLTSSVSVVMGDGLLSLSSFSLGTGHIVADMCDAFNLTAEQAEEILKGYSLLGSQNEIYEIETGEETKQVEKLEVREIVIRRVKQIASMIQKCLNLSEDVPQYLPVLLTGDGICEIGGATQILKEILGREVKVIAPNDKRLNSPKHSKIVSLLDLALKQKKQKSGIGMFFIKLFKKN